MILLFQTILDQMVLAFRSVSNQTKWFQMKCRRPDHIRCSNSQHGPFLEMYVKMKESGPLPISVALSRRSATACVYEGPTLHLLSQRSRVHHRSRIGRLLLSLFNNMFYYFYVQIWEAASNVGWFFRINTSSSDDFSGSQLLRLYDWFHVLRGTVYIHRRSVTCPQ